MATREQLAQALVNAHKAGDKDAARKIAQEMRRVAGPAPVQVQPEPGTARERYGMALGQAMLGPAQLAANVMEKADPRNYIGAKDGYSAAPVKELVNEIGAARKQANPPGLDGGDVAEFAGEATTAVVGGVPARAGALGPAFASGRPAMRAAKVGAASGAGVATVAPVEGDQYWAGKAVQVPTAATGGAVLGPLFTRAAEGLARLFRRGSIPQQNITVTVNQILQQRGIDPQRIGADFRRQIETEVRRAAETGGIVDDRALGNLATLESIGARGSATRGLVTQEPTQFGRELSLRETSPDLAARYQGVRNAANQRLGDIQQNAPQVTVPQAGRDALRVLRDVDQRSRLNANQLYEAAERAQGNSLFITSRQPHTDALRELRQRRAWDDLDPAAKRILSDMSRGRLTVRQAVEDIESLNARWQPGDRKNIGLGIVKRHLQEAIDDASTQAGPAYRLAQQAWRQRKTQQEALPALEAASKARTPEEVARLSDDFMSKNVYNASVSDLTALRDTLVQNNGQQAWNQIKGRVIADLREAAQRGDERKFAQASYNAKLRELESSELLGVFFTAGEQQMLRNVGRAGQLIEGPPGVSRTGLGGVARGLDTLGKMLSRYGGKWLGGPLASGVEKVSTTVESRAAQRLPSVGQAGNVLPARIAGPLAAGVGGGVGVAVPLINE